MYLPFDENEYYEQRDGERGCATDMDAVREYARNVGAENQDREWILDPRDCWTRNPFYTGKPGRHPEDDSDDEGEDS